MKNVFGVLMAIGLAGLFFVSCKEHAKVPATDSFYQAALDGQLDKVEEEIDNHVDVNSAGEDSITALMYAAYNGHVDIVELLLNEGANVNMVDTARRNALMYGSSFNSVETIELLLDAGAQVNSVDKREHWTPFMFAASEGLVDVMKVLLEHGADKNSADIDGETALDFAIDHQHVAAIEYLIGIEALSKNGKLGIIKK